MAVSCQVGGRFSRCRNQPAHTCQYCGRSFCAQHTGFVKDHEEVCSRKRCVDKIHDLQDHLAYRQGVHQRNHAGLCGVENCVPHPGFECSLCEGRFCREHLSERMWTFREGYAAVDRPVSICRHCWERRKVWRYR